MMVGTRRGRDDCERGCIRGSSDGGEDGGRGRVRGVVAVGVVVVVRGGRGSLSRTEKRGCPQRCVRRGGRDGSGLC